MLWDTCITRCILKKRCDTWTMRTCHKYCLTRSKIWPNTCCASAATKSARKAKNLRKSSRWAAPSAQWWSTAQKPARSLTSPNTKSYAPGCINASWGKYSSRFVALKSVLASAASPRQKHAQCQRRKRRTVDLERSSSKTQTPRRVLENTPIHSIRTRTAIYYHFPFIYCPYSQFFTQAIVLRSFFTDLSIFNFSQVSVAFQNSLWNDFFNKSFL